MEIPDLTTLSTSQKNSNVDQFTKWEKFLESYEISRERKDHLDHLLILTWAGLTLLMLLDLQWCYDICILLFFTIFYKKKILLFFLPFFTQIMKTENS
ncbi:hypothetical protein BpHYR1_043687 [Brachionus plicatilis]|uniref:Uncharacterized protein n=1 Tax=Brachionus plicatilis TaxID=10195 RepID=A0A3M7RR79_BRAPC|nr:hypothetical protein BpHYR1_043687 [Brachionus plicatilis]